MLSNTFFGCIVFLTTNISLLYTSHLFVRRFFPNAPPSVRLVAIGILYYSFILLIFQALSPFHAITKTWVTISCLLITFVFHFTWGKQKNVQADIKPIMSWIRDGLTSRRADLLIICGFVVLLSFSRALLMPPLTWTSLGYHLNYAASWIKKGALVLSVIPEDILMYSQNYPINGEIIASWFLLPFHNDLLANTMNFPITLLGGISCYAIARELGLTRKEASFAPALICFSPMIYSQITTQLVDTVAFAFYSASALFTLRYLRRGYLNDGFLAFAAAGILLGVKYTGVPAVGVIVIVSATKTINLVKHPGFIRKLSLIFLGLLIICTLGGRQYIGNTIKARNPFYPFPFKIFNHEIFEGWPLLEQLNEYLYESEKESGLDKFSWWNREYRKFCYISNSLNTAGPKFFPFLILAFVSLFTRPRDAPRRYWYFLSLMWIVPIVFFYTNSSTNCTRVGPFLFIDGSVRYISAFFALFTIQALVVIQKISNHFKKTDFFLTALVAWDLLHVNKTHIWEVVILYPFLVLIIPLILILLTLTVKKLKIFDPKKESFLISTGSSRVTATIPKRWATYALIFISLVAGLYFLQTYRDNTRYAYYLKHSDRSPTARYFVNAWEFLDKPGEKKTIVMTSELAGNWLFYPLFGRWLQNEIAYVSAKHKSGVPTRYGQASLREKNFSIWRHNLDKEKVDYILAKQPWSIELNWMLSRKNMFKPVFSDRKFRIFKYLTNGAER